MTECPSRQLPTRKASALAPWSRRAAPLIGFALLTLGAYVLFRREALPFEILDDGIRDQMLVRDCTELGRCHTIGAATSVPGRVAIYQGAVWLDLLTAVRLLGGDAATQVTVVLLLNALAAGLTFIVVWRWLHPTLAIPAGFLVATLVQEQPSLLVNGSAPLLFNTVTVAGLLCYGMSNRARFLLIAAFAAALAVNVHAASITLVPPLLLVAALGPRPHRHLLMVGMVYAGVYLATSGSAFSANLVSLADRKALVLLLLPAVLLLVPTARLGPLFRRRAVHVRAALIGCFLILPFVFAARWLELIEGRAVESRYYQPVVAPVAVFLAALACAPFSILARRRHWLRWAPSVAAVLLLVVLIAFANPTPEGTVRPAWAFSDATRIGLEAGKAGWSYEDLAFHLQARGCRQLLMGIGVEGALPNRKRPKDDVQLQVTTVDAGVTLGASDHTVVPLELGRHGALRTIHSWMRPRQMVVCRQSVDAPGAPSCMRLPTRTMPSEGRSLAESRMGMLYQGTEVPPPYVTRYRIPVRPVGGQTREFRLADPGVEGCRWQFTEARGLKIGNTLPDTHVLVEGQSGRAGALLLEKTFGGPACPAGESELTYPPCIFETPPGEASNALVTDAG